MRKFFTSFIFVMLLILCHAKAPAFPEQISSLDLSLTEKIHYQQSGNNLIGHLEIGKDRPIDKSTYLHVKFALEEFKKRDVIFVLLHLNTPGGEVFPSMKIAELLQELDAQSHIPVVAMVDNWALSAGAMLAYSCRYIFATDTALMGAAEPVTTGAEGKMETAPEKMISALRAEFASLAKFWGRDPLIAEAMVDKDITLVKRHGQLIKLNSPQEIRTGGKDPDQVISMGGKLLTLDASQMIDLGVANFILPITASSEQPAVQSPLFHYPFFGKLPQATLIDYHDWKIDFFAILSHPLVSSLLMMGLIIGIYMEMSSPGFGLPALTALICLGLILLSNFATEAINWLEILIVVLGVLLLLAEIFILPGFGVMGIIGILLILVGLLTMFLPNLGSIHFSWNWQEWNIPAIECVDRLSYNLAALIAALIIITLMSRFVTPRLLKRSRIVLEEGQEGNIAGPETHTLPLVGLEGESFTSLRPGGKILIQDQIYDALSEGNFIERGEKVVVSKIQGSAIIVAKKVF